MIFAPVAELAYARGSKPRLFGGVGSNPTGSTMSTTTDIELGTPTKIMKGKTFARNDPVIDQEAWTYLKRFRSIVNLLREDFKADEIAVWMTSPDGDLGGQTPLRYIEDEDQFLILAQMLQGDTPPAPIEDPQHFYIYRIVDRDGKEIATHTSFGTAEWICNQANKDWSARAPFKLQWCCITPWEDMP